MKKIRPSSLFKTIVFCAILFCLAAVSPSQNCFASHALSCGDSCQISYKTQNGTSKLLNQIFLGREGDKEIWLFINPGASDNQYDYRVVAFDTYIEDVFDALWSIGMSCFESLESYKSNNPGGYADYSSLKSKTCSGSSELSLDWYKACQFGGGTFSEVYGESPTCYYSFGQRDNTPALSDSTRLQIWKNIKANSPKMMYCYKSTCKDNPSSFGFSFGYLSGKIRDGLVWKGNLRGTNIYLDD